MYVYTCIHVYNIIWTCFSLCELSKIIHVHVHVVNSELFGPFEFTVIAEQSELT